MTDTLRVTVELNGTVAIDETASVGAPTPPPAPPAEILSPDSQWRRLLGAQNNVDVFYDGQSTPVGRWVGDRIKYERTVQGNGPWVATSNSTSYVWVADANTPRRKVLVRPDLSKSWRVPLQKVFDTVPIPDGVYTTTGEDAVLTVYEKDADELYEMFWYRQPSEYGGAEYASCHWGGATKNASRSFGVYDMASWPPWSRPNWGATAGSHIFAAGLITQAELQAGEIKHAIAVDFGKMRAGVVTHPAFRTDGLNLDPYSVPYGAHFRLPPEMNLDALTFATPFAKMVAKAMQKYGMIARNQTGSAFTIFCEDPRPSGNKNAFWNDDGTPAPNGWFKGLNPPAALDGIPWDGFLLLEQYKQKTYPTFQVEGEPTVWQRSQMLDMLTGRNPAASRYLGLFSVPPGRAGGGTEIAGGRAAVDPAVWSSPADTGTNVTIFNTAAVSFPSSSAARPAPVAVGLFDAATGGKLLAYGWLPPHERNPIPANYVVRMAPQSVWFQDVGVSFYPEVNL